MFPPLIPVNLQDWLAAHRDQLKPPVGNKCLYRGEDLIVMAVGGPNARKDYHIDPYEEYFHQLEGDLLLKLGSRSGCAKAKHCCCRDASPIRRVAALAR